MVGAAVKKLTKAEVWAIAIVALVVITIGLWFGPGAVVSLLFLLLLGIASTLLFLAVVWMAARIWTLATRK
jgi:hypothetical protein